LALHLDFSLSTWIPMWKLLLLFFISSSLSSGFAQSQGVNNSSTSQDSFKKLTQISDLKVYVSLFTVFENQLKLGKDNNKLAELYVLHSDFLYKYSAYDSIVNTLHLARGLLDSRKDDKSAEIFLSLSEAFYSKGNYDSLVYWYDQAGKLISTKSPHYGTYLLVGSYKSTFDADYSGSIQKLLEAIPIFEAQSDLPKLALALNSLAFNYEKLEDYLKQREYLLKAIEINEKQGRAIPLISNYNNIGSSYRKEGLLQEAIKYYDLAFDQLKLMESPMLLAQNMTNRANILEKLGDYEQAEKLFLECKRISEEHNITYGVMLTDLNLGNLYRLIRDFPKAYSHLEKGLSVAQEMKLRRETALAFKQLSLLYKDDDNFKQAYEFSEKFHALNDSLVNESVRNKANELMEKYEAEKKENEIIILSKKKLYQQYVIALMVIALILLLFTVHWCRNKQKLTKIKLRLAEKLNEAKEETLKQREKDLLLETIEKAALKEQMIDIVKKINGGDDYEKIGSQLRSIESKQNPWNDMIKKFKLLNPQFVEKLLQSYPQLNQNDLEFCSLIKMNLSTKEIAQILRITDQSVRTRKYRLLKKLELSSETDLDTCFKALNAYN
jgi:tetratricopeptide (TPR) repeat protein/DNA-binding CsgD family transcriptional regulator